ncbi:hypothetical protein [Geothrix sp. 21YS21S-4]|uniref:hypothetical protein n=1 Tax=Geothrix sp. 21YS21S-4 TaxID=3068889 RepID=UPI0027B94FB1|nr:hypothetical protein [Geothrix sp. 21YS21S-4]
MTAALLALATLGAAAQKAPVSPPIPPAAPGELPCDAKDKQPLLLGRATREAVLSHRAVFRERTVALKLAPDLKARWAAIRRPFTLVAVFGSWCGDSHEHLPQLLALEADPNPFIDVQYLGVYRDKALNPAAWPQGCPPQPVTRVPTFYLFALQPGGVQKLVGTVVEHPPKEGQSMAEALVELTERASRS